MKMSEPELLINKLTAYFRKSLVSQGFTDQNQINRQGTGYHSVKKNVFLDGQHVDVSKFMYDLSDRTTWVIEWVQDEFAQENNSIDSVWFCMSIVEKQEDCPVICKVVQEVCSITDEDIHKWDQSDADALMRLMHGRLLTLPNLPMPKFRKVTEDLRAVVTPFDKYADTLKTVIVFDSCSVENKHRFFPEKSAKYIALPQKSIRPRGSDIEYTFEIYVEPLKQLVHSLFYLCVHDNTSIYPEEIEGSEVIHTESYATEELIDIEFIVDIFKSKFVFNELCP